MAYDSDDAHEVTSEEEILEVTSGSSSDADEEEAYWLDSTDVSDASSESCELLDLDQPLPDLPNRQDFLDKSTIPIIPMETDLLKHCLDYCSHAWPSPEVHESLLHTMLGPSLGPASSSSSNLAHPCRDPADLSALPFSDGSDQENTKEASDLPVANGPGPCLDANAKTLQSVGLRPSALNPQLTSKHAKKAHMQRLVHQEIERKRLEELSSSWPSAESMRRRQAESLLPVLEDLGYTLDDVEEIFKSCSDDSHEVQMQVESILESSRNRSHSWLTSIPRKRQRETGLKEQRKLELGMLKSKFGSVMRELEVREDGVPEVTPEMPQQSYWSDPAEHEERPESVTAAGTSAMPEVASIRHMSRVDCKNLLRQMKPLAHAPAALYKALAARALAEYVRVKPLTLHDCRQITFWQFGGSERSGCGADRCVPAASSVFFSLFCFFCQCGSLSANRPSKRCKVMLPNLSSTT